jgi:hypothetical protein
VEHGPVLVASVLRMISAALAMWFASILLVDGRAVVGRFETQQDCRTNVAYASVNQDVIAIARDAQGRACQRLGAARATTWVRRAP